MYFPMVFKGGLSPLYLRHYPQNIKVLRMQAVSLRQKNTLTGLESVHLL